MKVQKLSFKNDQGDELSARLDMPIDGAPVATALFAHCFTCSKNLNAVKHISNTLAMNGIAVLRFDFTGLGESEGEWADTNFTTNVEDLVKAAEFLEQELIAPSLLIGHSLGGAAVLLAAHQIESVQAVVTIAAPADPVHVTKLFKDKEQEIAENGIVDVELEGRPFKIKKQFLDDIHGINMQKHIKELHKPLLILHAPGDNTVGIENAAAIYNAAMHPKSFISLAGADHLLTDKKDSTYVGDVIATWVKRYVETPTEAKLHTHLNVLASTDMEAFRTEIVAGPHTLVADEPESVGGEDLGPDPYELLTAALGACTGMTIRMYAERKQWPLENVKVHLKHEKVHANDADDENESAQIDEMTREIELTGDLSDEQRERLLQIANKCPVHRTLSETKVVVKTSLK